MFPEWEQLVVRLDVWHFMRCFAMGVTTDSHQLYGLYMRRISHCIFAWDAGDVALLAKRSELEEKQGMTGLSDDQVNDLPVHSCSIHIIAYTVLYG